MIVVVAGSSGLIGTALVGRLRAEGHEVRRLVRRAPRTPDERTWDPDAGVLDPAALAGADAVVNLAGAGVGDKRLTPARKRVVLESRTRTTGLLARTVAGLDDPPRVLLQGSATGAYGYRGDTRVTEEEPYGTSYLAEVVRAWEAAAAPAVADPRVRVAFLRTGIVLAPSGGALGRLLPLIRLGLGGPLGSGRQYWSWISLEDEVRAILHLLDAPVSGGPQGARTGTLSTIISGEQAYFDRARPAIDAFANNVFYLGGSPGQAQVAKLVNNLLSLAGRVIAFEGMVMGMKVGIDPKVLAEFISVSTGRNLAVQDQFPMRLLQIFGSRGKKSIGVKDTELFLEEAERLGVPVWTAPKVLELFQEGAGYGVENPEDYRLTDYVERLLAAAGRKSLTEPAAGG